MSKKLVTPIGMVSFPAVFEPNRFDEAAKPKYSVTLAFKKDQVDLAPLREAIKSAVVEKWGPDRTKWPVNLRKLDFDTYLSSTGRDGWPLRDGDEQGRPEYEGAVTVKFSSTRKPVAYGRGLNILSDLEAEEIYPGCFCRVQTVAYAYDVSGSKGITFTLDAIQKIADGERIGGPAVLFTVADEEPPF
jgi:hypothetical protein